jgi:hypothetical protein
LRTNATYTRTRINKIPNRESSFPEARGINAADAKAARQFCIDPQIIINIVNLFSEYNRLIDYIFPPFLQKTRDAVYRM